MSQFCIVAFFETDDITRDAPLVVGGFDDAAKARAYAARDEKLRTAAEIEIAPYVQAAGVSTEPLFTIYLDGHFEKFYDLDEWYFEQVNFDDPDDCLGILREMERAGTSRWAEVDYRQVDSTEFTVAFRDLLAKVAPTLTDELEREEWLEVLAELNEKVAKIAEQLKLTISAEAHSDDWQREIRFDATPYFVQASDHDLVELVKCGFGGDYPADYLMLHFEETLPDVDSLLAWSRGDGDTGFECHVDEREATRWLARFRPQVLEQADAG